MNNLRKITDEKDYRKIGIIWGVFVGIAIIAISVALTFFLMYNFQPSFMCDLCNNSCDLIPNFVP